jgi:hypothetical protein
MDGDKIAILHEHYRDTCAGMGEHRNKRDRYFYLVLLVLAIALFDLTAPDGFATATADVLKSKLGLTTSPDLTYVRSLLWFLLLGLTVRYGQAALELERLYRYLRDLEDALAKGVGAGFRREGRAYASFNPLFRDWAHYLYTLVFPTLLAVVTIAWTWQQIPGPPWPMGAMWPLAVWFDCTVTAAILVSLILYLHAFHLYDHRRGSKP